MSKKRKEEIEFIESIKFRDRNKFIFKILLNDDNLIQKQSFSLFDVLFLFQNYPSNKEDLLYVYSLKMMYSILIHKLLIDKKYNDIRTLINNQNINLDLFPMEVRSNIFFKSNKIIFKSSIAIKKMSLFYKYFLDDDSKILEENKNNVNKIYKLIIDNLKIIIVSIKEENKTKLTQTNSILDELDLDELDLLIPIIENNNYYWADKDSAAKLIEKLHSSQNKYLNDFLSKFVSIIEVMTNIEKYDSSKKEKLNLLLEKITNKQTNKEISIKNNKIKELLNLNENLNYLLKLKSEYSKNFGEIKLFETLELSYVFIKYFTKEEFDNLESDLNENLFIKLINYFTNTESKSSFSNFKDKNITLTEIPFIEFLLYDLYELISPQDSNSNILKKTDMKKLNKFWNNDNSMNKKLSKWLELGYNSALPINTLDTMEKILLESNVLKYLDSIGKEKFTDTVISIFKAINTNLRKNDNDLIKDIHYAFKEHPLIKPFLNEGEDNKYIQFIEIFKFIFDDAVKEIKDE